MTSESPQPKPRPKALGIRCPKCRSRTTKKMLEQHEMCPRCWRIWSRPSFATRVAALTTEDLREVRNLLRSKPNMALVASAMKKRRPDVEWDIGTVAVAWRRAEDEGVTPG